MSQAKLQLALPRRQPPHLTGRPIKRSKNIAIFLLVAALLQFIAVSCANRTALSAKYSPTTYTSISIEQNERLTAHNWEWNGEQVVGENIPGYSRPKLLEGRHEWETLDSGFEADNFKYGSVVVKAYRPTHAPFRNCMPGHDLRWPTDISASLVLTGLSEWLTTGENGSYVPIVDYFLAPEGDNEDVRWHLVRPYLPSGHLKNLAKRLRKSEAKHTAQEIDVLFRTSFEN